MAEYSKCALEIIKNGLCILVMVPFVYTVITDINNSYRQKLEEARTEIEKCTIEYTRNHCWPLEERRPALEEFCATHEVCMMMPVEQRAKYMEAITSYIADTSISFTDRLTWQALLFLMALLYLTTSVLISGSRSPKP